MKQKIDEYEWRVTLDNVSKSLSGQRAEVEIASLSLGDQIAAEWLPVLGITYDSGDDIVEVALEGVDHIISRPRELHLQLTDGHVAAIEIIDGDGIQHIVKFKEPLMLAGP
ncbi:DUF5335 family protein [Hyphomicrobium sp.]|uniref:DUF5335 family protein n=1 Tax=Hyphomicrobium sp. TaxID=82 RepID=UPI002D786866|nr:DUF5335 family protein [Hyphomicrobium sp.]HET6389826.1 DUF5335 family protein [Hyphomicrobium sp.]